MCVFPVADADFFSHAPFVSHILFNRMAISTYSIITLHVQKVHAETARETARLPSLATLANLTLLQKERSMAPKDPSYASPPLVTVGPHYDTTEPGRCSAYY